MLIQNCIVERTNLMGIAVGLDTFWCARGPERHAACTGLPACSVSCCLRQAAVAEHRMCCVMREHLRLCWAREMWRQLPGLCRWEGSPSANISILNNTASPLLHVCSIAVKGLASNAPQLHQPVRLAP